jgi:hypothetical protein
MKSLVLKKFPVVKYLHFVCAVSQMLLEIEIPHTVPLTVDRNSGVQHA